MTPEVSRDLRPLSVSVEQMLSQNEKIRALAERYTVLSSPFCLFITDQDGKIVEANRKSREVFELPSAGEVGGTIWDFYSDPAQRDSIVTDLKESAGTDEWGQRRAYLRIKDREFLFEQYWRSIQDSDGDRLGHLCLMADVTERAALKGKLEEFQDDVGNVLHTYTSTLLMIKFAVESVIDSLAPNPFKANEQVSPEQAAEVLSAPAARLMSEMERLASMASATEHPALRDAVQELISPPLEALRTYEQQLQVEFRPTVLGQISREVVSACERLRGRHVVGREAVRQIQASAQELSRLVNLVALLKVTSVIKETGHQLGALREFVLHDRRAERTKVIRRVRGLISQAVSQLDDFAESRGVQLRMHLEQADVSVVVDERGVVRALGNILHNAIKYSWERDRGGPVRVTLRTRLRENILLIEVENWGVPIPGDEIERGLIFKIGYRGRLAAGAGRAGTGVGLADAQQVAREHGGEVSVMSRPAVQTGEDENYTQPFLTTVSLSLPIHATGGDGIHEN